jgi:small-conductance mechanosensitive channel/predicted  nucleic acid-binding Zn-ribbon protein
VCFILFATLLVQQTVLAQANTAATDSSEAISESSPTPESRRAQAVRKLLAIKEALEDKRARVRDLLEQLASADEMDKAKINEQIADLRETIDALTKSFESIAVSGASLRDQADAESTNLDLRDELAQIAKPILDSLKDATEKPRRLEELRRTIALQEQQLEVIRTAIESISDYRQYELPATVNDGLAELFTDWQERGGDIERSLEITRHELRNLETEDFKVFETLGLIVQEFILGRGLTLLLALIVAIAVWFTMRLLRRLASTGRQPAQSTNRAARMRLLLYGYHLLTILLITLAVLSVFYVRGDLLLLSLTMIALVMLSLGAWRFLPGYIMEARLLLNAGAAREGERVIYNGLPFRIVSLNLNSHLRNPELQGVIRLPLAELAHLISRPATEDEWFPCSAGDYLLLPDGSFGQVLQQTVELVHIKVIGSIVQYRSADFLQLNVRNLSREGFGVMIIFGIDYQHQEISLERVPTRFEEGLVTAFEQADFGKDLQDLQVSFNEASASSLDYLIYATMDGRSAGSYFAIRRLIQQTCVDICNREGWVIPFAQLTVHQAETMPADASALPKAT